MMYFYFIKIFLILVVLYFYTKSNIPSILFKRKHNIKPIMTSVQIICHIVVYMAGIINIGFCVWALFNN